MTKVICEQLERLVAELPYGDGLMYARDILKDEWTEETERVARALFNHEPFDLSLLIENYTAKFATDCLATLQSSDDELHPSDFRYLNDTLREWIETAPQRRVAALVCYIVLSEETAWASRENPAVQDYYAEQCWYPGSVNWQNESACDDFTQRSMKGMTNVDLHYIEAAEEDLDLEQVRVVDALRGWSPQVFDNDMVVAGKEIVKVANEMLHNEKTPRTHAGARMYIINVLEEVQRIADEHEVDVDVRDAYSLSTGYLAAWIENKYWGNHRKEDDE